MGSLREAVLYVRGPTTGDTEDNSTQEVPLGMACIIQDVHGTTDFATFSHLG